MFKCLGTNAITCMWQWSPRWKKQGQLPLLMDVAIKRVDPQSRGSLVVPGDAEGVGGLFGSIDRLACFIMFCAPPRTITTEALFRDELPPKLVAYDEWVFRRTDKYELLARVNAGREWILRIRDVQEDDAGPYICQLNTNPVISRKGHLDLRIPPSISVREGNNVTMTCAASGNPKPTIVWRRSDRRIIRYNEADGYGDTVHKGAELTLSRVSRKHMGEYVCVASNGIPPDETLAIKLHVLFEPVVMPQTMVAEAPLNALVVRIACTVEAWSRQKQCFQQLQQKGSVVPQVPKNNIGTAPLLFEAQTCSSDDCSGRGTCIGTKSFPVCLCSGGSAGTRCQDAPCDPSVNCNSRGFCMGTLAIASCLCNVGYSGDQCQYQNGK